MTRTWKQVGRRPLSIFLQMQVQVSQTNDGVEDMAVNRVKVANQIRVLDIKPAMLETVVSANDLRGWGCFRLCGNRDYGLVNLSLPCFSKIVRYLSSNLRLLIFELIIVI